MGWFQLREVEACLDCACLRLLASFAFGDHPVYLLLS